LKTDEIPLPPPSSWGQVRSPPSLTGGIKGGSFLLRGSRVLQTLLNVHDNACEVRENIFICVSPHAIPGRSQISISCTILCHGLISDMGTTVNLDDQLLTRRTEINKERSDGVLSPKMHAKLIGSKRSPKPFLRQRRGSTHGAHMIPVGLRDFSPIVLFHYSDIAPRLDGLPRSPPFVPPVKLGEDLTCPQLDGGGRGISSVFKIPYLPRLRKPPIFLNNKPEARAPGFWQSPVLLYRF
jgi:hypothetical protein